jgi:hypothetical protein
VVAHDVKAEPINLHNREEACCDAGATPVLDSEYSQLVRVVTYSQGCA